MVSSVAHVSTQNGSRYLQQLCKHWSHKFTVEFTTHEGTVNFSEEEAVKMVATADELVLTVQSMTPSDVQGLETVVADHLARFSFKEDLAFEWKQGE